MLRIIQIILIVLKVFKLITISWWLVFAPTLFVCGLYAIFPIMIMLMYITLPKDKFNRFFKETKEYLKK